MISEVNQSTKQIIGFKNLINEVNKIPNITIDLNDSIDRQRDALAFVVDEIYRQFNDSNWELILNEFIQNIKMWNTPPNSAISTRKIVNFIKHLFESRVFFLIENEKLDEKQKVTIKNIHKLYVSNLDTILKTSPIEKPIKLGGIPITFLPEWYINKVHLKTNSIQEGA
jgi:hypothetical protein